MYESLLFIRHILIISTQNAAFYEEELKDTIKNTVPKEAKIWKSKNIVLFSE